MRMGHGPFVPGSARRHQPLVVAADGTAEGAADAGLTVTATASAAVRAAAERMTTFMMNPWISCARSLSTKR
jgi:hypothetical protein